eukprot:3926691-Pyramimonas_sp.AAC.1
MLIYPDRSLTASCAQSVDLAELSLWRVIELTHADYRPPDLSTWVGDLGQIEIGPEVAVVDRTMTVATPLAKLSKAGFKISSKSALITYPSRLATHLPGPCGCWSGPQVPQPGQ